MNRRLKIAACALASLLGLAAVLALAGVLVARSAWFREKVRERIVYEVERATGGRVELDAFAFDWRRLRAEARAFVLHGTEEAGQPPLFRAESVEVALKLVSAFRRDIDIEAATLRRPEIHVIVYSNGRTNLPRPRLERAGRNPVEVFLRLAVRRFAIEDGVLLTELHRLPLNLRGERLRMQLAYEALGPRYRGQVSFRQLHITAGELPPLPLDFDADVAIERNRIEVATARLAFKSSTAGARGAIRDLFTGARAEFDYEARIALRELAPALRLAVADRGDVSLAGKVTLFGTPRYALGGRLSAAGLAFQQRGIRIEDIRVASDLSLSEGKIELRGLAVSMLDGRFTGRADIERFREFRLEGNLQDFSVQRLTALEGDLKSAWNGRLSGAVSLAGEFRDGQARIAEARGRVSIAPSPGDRPVEGLIELAYDQRRGSLELGRSYLATPSSRVQFAGTLGRRLDVGLESRDLDDFLPALAAVEEAPRPLPLALNGGMAAFRGTVSGPLNKPVVDGHVALHKFIAEGRPFERLEADLIATPAGAVFRNAVVESGRVRATGQGQIGLSGWKPEPGSTVAAVFTLPKAELADLLAEAGQKLPVKGSASGTIEIAGTAGNPGVTARIRVVQGAAYEQPFDSLRAEVRHSGTRLEVPSAEIDLGGSRIAFSGSFDHAPENWQRGRARFEVQADRVPLGRLAAVQQRLAGAQGTAEGRLAGELAVDGEAFRIARLDGRVDLQGLTLEKKPLGRLALVADTKDSSVSARIEGQLLGARIEGSSEWRLEGDYPVTGALRFTRLELSTLLDRLGREPGAEAPFTGFAEGRLQFSGSTVQPESWKGIVELSALEMMPRVDKDSGLRAEDLTVRSAGPVVIELDGKFARVVKGQFKGQGTDLDVTGTVAFQSRNPWNLRVRGDMNLAVLRNFERDLRSAGALTIDAVLRGPLARPDVYGRAEFKNASFYWANVPNGLDNVNGVVFLYRDRASIEALTAQTGGGKLTVSGFVGFGAETTYRVQARTSEVRVRYPEGMSTTWNAVLNLTGTTARSVVSGDVTITRMRFNPRTDFGSILARSAEPVTTPAPRNRLLRGMQFDVHIQTSSDVQVETALTRDIQAEASLWLRGGVSRPVLLGHVLVSGGEIVFFGNKYDINSGEINFLNPVRIEPVVNLDLQTRVRGIDVNLGLSGPANKMSLSYRSDPPLQPSEIIALLTVGREPVTTPGLVGRQELTQGWQQTGNALVGHALASPVTGRLQRFFGVSRIKIDPQLTGLDNNPTARLTLEQQISKNLTFTYITNLTQSQQQAVRIEWNFEKNWSVIALREENGQFGVDFLYKKQFK